MADKLKTEIHLISSVYLSSVPLGHQRYDTSKLGLNLEKNARVGRFLTGLMSLKEVSWTSSSFYISFDEPWDHLYPSIKKFIETHYPQAKVTSGRLAKRSDWLRAAEGLKGDSLVYLHANDDHALVADASTFEAEAIRLSDHVEAQLMMVTHFPEVTGMLYRKKPLRPLSNGSAFPVEFALGTTLVKTEFYRSWWSHDRFEDDELIYRPDNPVGRSVTFGKTFALAPLQELLRHMDGYAHVFCQKPLAPLRNTVPWVSILDGAEAEPPNSNRFREELWPSRIVGLSGKGADIHSTKSPSNFSAAVRMAVARLNAQWALRVNIFDLQRARNFPTQIKLVPFFFATVIAMALPRNIRNIVDSFLDPVFIIVLYLLGSGNSKAANALRNVYYLGASRAIQARLSKMN